MFLDRGDSDHVHMRVHAASNFKYLNLLKHKSSYDSQTKDP